MRGKHAQPAYLLLACAECVSLCVGLPQCRERVGGERRCLMRLSFHSCVLADGRTFNGYQVQVWPLGHAPLRHPPPLNIGQDPAPPMVV